MQSLRVALAWLWLGIARGSASTEAKIGEVDAQHGGAAVRAESAEHGSELEVLEADATMEDMVSRLLSRDLKVPSHSELIAAGEGKVDLQKALHLVEGKLPQDVASLVSTGVRHREEGAQAPSFDEASLKKALNVLNSLVEKAWAEMDDKLIECKEFEDKNRGSFNQVMIDIARLGEDLANLERLRAEATEQIVVQDQNIIRIQMVFKQEYSSYMRTWLQNSRKMTIHKNDLAVFQFMMQLTKCKSALLLQQPAADGAWGPKVCENEEGLGLAWGDVKAEEKLYRMMTPSSRAELRAMLEGTQTAQGGASLLQETASHKEGSEGRESEEEDDDDDEVEEGVATTTTTATTTTMGFSPPAVKMKVVKRPASSKGWIKCTRRPPDCGLLHDKMSLLWGKFRDLVDELQSEMDKNEFHWKELKANLLAQLDVFRNSKARFVLQLNEAIANIASTREEMSEKDEERAELEHEYMVYMKGCRRRIKWIMFQDICSYNSVRGTVMKSSTACPPKNIIDCDWSAWVPGDCSVPCDDSCPDPTDPYACGGWQILRRSFVVRPNSCGYKCPAPTKRRKCNQIKCPVNCVMSKWSGWSKCSRDCEGGAQGRTRSLIVQPKNGGMACNTAQVSRPCNTGSCDRNCRLKKWSKWSPCSVACDGGFQERWRRVLIPIRGSGRCPKRKSYQRYSIKNCNTHKCRGDEICIAKQDLVLSIDASGSLQKTGFDIVKGFAKKLIGKYMGMYFGFEDMKIGVVQFGNGEIMPDGSISDALLIQELTSDMETVKASIDGLEYKKGFTNMAQAFGVAEKVLLLGGRKAAQSAVLTMTDGKPSFLFQTYEKVMQLKDKHTKLFFTPITEFKGAEMKLMKKWASKPWMTNLVHIPGLDAMAADENVFAQKMLVKFCPEAISSSEMFQDEEVMGYLLVREQGLCGAKGTKISSTVEGAEDCAALAEGGGFKAFALGIRYARGRCYGMPQEFTADKIADIKKNRGNPPCPASDGWRESTLYDFYVLEPIAAGL